MSQDAGRLALAKIAELRSVYSTGTALMHVAKELNDNLGAMRAEMEMRFRGLTDLLDAKMVEVTRDTNRLNDLMAAHTARLANLDLQAKVVQGWMAEMRHAGKVWRVYVPIDDVTLQFSDSITDVERNNMAGRPMLAPIKNRILPIFYRRYMGDNGPNGRQWCLAAPITKYWDVVIRAQPNLPNGSPDPTFIVSYMALTSGSLVEDVFDVTDNPISAVCEAVGRIGLEVDWDTNFSPAAPLSLPTFSSLVKVHDVLRVPSEMLSDERHGLEHDVLTYLNVGSKRHQAATQGKVTRYVQLISDGDSALVMDEHASSIAFGTLKRPTEWEWVSPTPTQVLPLDSSEPATSRV